MRMAAVSGVTEIAAFRGFGAVTLPCSDLGRALTARSRLCCHGLNPLRSGELKMTSRLER